MNIEKKVPDYLINRNNTILYLIFVMFFSILFVNVFTPFQGAWYNVGDFPRSQLFFFSVIIVLGGVVVMTISRLLLGLINRKMPITVIHFSAWLVIEMFVIAVLYAVICRLGLQDKRSFYLIFLRAMVYVPLILVIPTVISYLFFSLRERDRLISNLSTMNNVKFVEAKEGKSAESSEIINFIDEKNELKLSVRADYIYYVEASDNYVYIYYDDKGAIVRFLLRSSMKRQEEQLKPVGFVRCHRSFIVNFSKVVLMRKDKDGPYLDLGHKGIRQIPVSKTYLNQITDLFTRNV